MQSPYRIWSYLACLTLLAVGCREELGVQDGFVVTNELGCAHGKQGDMAPPVAPCAAAKGLSGDILGNLCIDFSTIPDQTLMDPPPQQLPGWTFNNPPGCWEIMGGILQKQDFKDFASTCAFQMPAVSSEDFNKYNSFTLSVVQTLNVNFSQQQALIMLGQPDNVNNLVDWTTGTQPRQRRIYEIAKSGLPKGSRNAYQPLFQFSSSAGPGTGYTGWQIESIAILGNL